MTSSRSESDKIWYTGKAEYEGLPLWLRFPEKPDFDALQDRYPRLLTIEHHLAEIQSSGLPTASYHLTLFDFDEEILDMFGCHGFPVLVETFSGIRTYYIYLTDTVNEMEAISTLRSRYPEHKIETDVRPGKNWNLIRRYSADFRLYENG